MTTTPTTPSAAASAPAHDRAPRRRVTVYRFEDAPILEDTGMMEFGEMSDEIATIDTKELQTGIGYEARALFADTDTEDGVSLVHAWFGAGYPLPTHTHNADCLYFVLKGSAILGKTVVGPGDGFFVPTNTPYRYEAGPEGIEILEFRNAHQFDIQFVDQKPERWERDAKVGREKAAAWQAAHDERFGS